MPDWVHPAAILILGSVLVPFFKGRVKKVYLLVLPALAFLSVLTMSEGTYGVYHFLGQEITFGRVDKLSLAFAYIFTIVSFIGMCYGLHVREDGHHIASLVYAGSAMGVVFAGDFLTLLVFWEFLAFSSVFLILYRRTRAANNAAFRYILVHAFSGVCLMGGIFLQYTQTHSLAFNLVDLSGLAGGLIITSFIINAAVPPLGAWLPDAYPEATVTGAVFMTAFTTKSAVYVLARGFAGAEILIWLGTIMAVYGVVYAVLENDTRRLLAYHIVSQVGYMVAAVGIGTEMAVNGATAHAFAHILYKALLFMGAGSVLYMTGRSKLTELGGVYKTMPITFMLYMVGGFAISSVPLFSGFVSKSIVVSAAAESHLPWVWLFLTLASAGTFLHTGLKLPYFMFMAKDAGIKAKEPPTNMLVGMGLAAFLCIFIGVYPKFLYNLLPYAIDYRPYTPEHVVWTLEILLLTWLGFYIYIKKLGGESTISLDTDWFYRKGARHFMWVADRAIAAADTVVGEGYKTVVLASSIRTASGSLKFDLGIIDGMVNGVASTVLNLSSRMRRVQTGQLQHYAVAIMIGLFVLLNVVFFLL